MVFSETDVEGTYRRGYHQAVAAVAGALQTQSISVEDLNKWVVGDGMQWRKDITLAKQFAPPNFK